MDDQWQTVVLKTLREKASTYKPGTTYLIQVVQKIKNGKTVAVKIRVGETYIHAATGETRFKAGDLSTEDIKTINEHLPEIEALKKNPPPPPQPEPAAADDVGF